MEVFKVWTDLNIKGNALTEIQRFTTMVTQSSKAMTRIQKNLGMLSKEFGVLKMGIAGDNTELKMLGENLTSISRRTSHLTTQTAALSKSLGAVAAQGNAASRSLAMVSGGGVVGGRGKGKGWGHGFSHAGAIGMASIAPELSLMAGAGKLALPLAAAAGGGILVHKGYEQEKMYQQSMMQLKAQGLTPAQIGEVAKYANQVTPGLSPVDKIEAYVDAFMTTRNAAEAFELAPVLAEGQQAVKNVFGGKGMSKDQTMQAIRAAEMRAGTTDPKKQAHALETIYKMTILSGGSILPSQQAAFYRRAAGAAANMTDAGFFALEPVIQEYTGTSTGTAYRTVFRQLVTGVGLNYKDRTPSLIAHGILDKSGHIKKNVFEDLAHDFPKFVRDDVLPGLKKAGITTPEGITAAINKDYAGTGANLVSLQIKNMEASERAREQASKTMNLHDLFMQSLTTASGAADRLAKAFDSLTTAIGHVSTPLVVKGMSLISTGLEKAPDLIKSIPAIAKEVEERVPNLISNGAASNMRTGSLFSNVKEAPKQASQASQPVGVFIDAKRVGTAIFPYHEEQITAQVAVGMGMSTFNFSQTKAPNGASNTGGQQ